MIRQVILITGASSGIGLHTLLPARWWDAAVRILGKKIK